MAEEIEAGSHFRVTAVGSGVARERGKPSVILGEEYFDEGERRRVEEWRESRGARQSR